VRKVSFPVVSIGNLSTGGTGKTPLTIALARGLAGRGLHVDVLSRGYGRRNQQAVRVDAQGNAEEFGDEPLLIARQTGVPVYLAPKRYEAGLLAEGDLTAAAGFSAGQTRALHLLDDGFQHRQLARDVDILLLGRDDWKDRLLPAGNLREPISACRRASVIAIPAGNAAFEEQLRTLGMRTRDVVRSGMRGPGWSGVFWRLRRVMDVPPVDGPVLAFCGIARPAQFFDGLEAAGLTLGGQVSYPDHHSYTERDIQMILAAAAAAGAVALVTTEKDLVRLGEQAVKLAEMLPVKTAALRTVIEDEAAALDWLLDRLKIDG
jgi:tetraacyldisaccharide 4'-kinase